MDVALPKVNSLKLAPDKDEAEQLAGQLAEMILRKVAVELLRSYGEVVEKLRLLEFEGHHTIMTVEQAKRRSSTLQLRDSQQQAYVKQMIQYIESHYSEQISFDALSKHLHLTRTYLSYVFKKETGTSFIHYLTNYRIERAKELLLSGQHMIYEVSRMVGYADPAYFSRVFKKVTGVAPLEYVQ